MKTAILAVLLSAATVTTAAASPAATWHQFREAHPTPFQTLAISGAESNGSRTLIIAEPPPAVTLAAIRNRYAAILSDVTVHQQTIGYDGWVRDVVGTLVPMNDELLRTTIQNISRDLFGTSYKAYALDLSSEATPAERSYDLNVTAFELRDWLGLDRTAGAPAALSTQGGSSLSSLPLLAWVISIVAMALFLHSRQWRYVLLSTASLMIGFSLGESRTLTVEPLQANASRVLSGQLFRALHGGDPATLPAFLAEECRGVFVSTEPGLVALIVPRGRPLNESAVALREFALDSDLILGAVGDSANVAVIGRERQVAVEQLPPLRAETMIQLAAATTGALAQSYERMRFLAGKYDGLRDWAPILLSDELQDTEYGSLLNITDQLLKSWSQHGEIEYVNFHYPRPAAYPFPEPLDRFAQANRIAFNWNTKGVGYNDDRNGFDVLAFTRTGSLPVDYLGESNSRLQEAEDTGYDFFASQNDPNLVRVVQYAGLYQIWRKFGVSGSYRWSVRVRGGDRAITPLVEDAVRLVHQEDIDELIDDIGIAPDDAELRQGIAVWRELQDSMDEFVEEFGAHAIKDIVDYLVHPRSVTDPRILDRRHLAALALAQSIQGSALIHELIEPYIPRARKAYADAEGRADAVGWIKTPSIVVSWSTGDDAMVATGGHNLSSRVSHFAVDETLHAGRVRVATIGDEVTVYYSAEDAAKIGSSVRALTRHDGATAAELEATTMRSFREAVIENRTMASALKLGARPGIGQVSRRASGVVGDTATWRSFGGIPQAHAALLEQLKHADLVPIVVERQQGKYLISRAGSNVQIEAPDEASALDAISAGVRSESQATHLHLVGMEPDQARKFAQAVEIQSGDRGSRP